MGNTPTTKKDPSDDAEMPIRIRFSDAALEMGFSPIPDLFLAFYPYLRGPAGEQMGYSEAFFLIYVLRMKKGPDAPQFFLKDMDCPFSYGARRRYAANLRKMGVVLTKYYYQVETRQVVGYGKPPVPRIRVIEWNLDSLFHNLSLIFQEWQRRRDAQGRRVFYRLPNDYTHAVVIPPHLALAIATGEFAHVSEPIRAQAEAIAHEKFGDDAKVSITEIRARAQSARSRIGVDENARVTEIRARADLRAPYQSTNKEEEEKEENTLSIIFSFFATAIGAERYDSTEKETRRIAMLLADGFSIEEIQTGITRAVEHARAHNRIANLNFCLRFIRHTPADEIVPDSGKSSTREIVTGNGNSSAQIVSAEGKSSAAVTLDELASGDAELRDLLELVQERNPQRALQKSDARAWVAVGEKYRALASARGITPIALLNQAVLHGIGAQSDRAGYFAATLADAILADWAHPQAKTPARRAERGNGSGSARTPTLPAPPAGVANTTSKYPSDNGRFAGSAGETR
ncbi:MAG: hypothetical protein HZC40_00850 [Chloroflexi bacterium]|nr:hypothetical protein [Chloroflexota bacterium]